MKRRHLWLALLALCAAASIPVLSGGAEVIAAAARFPAAELALACVLVVLCAIMHAAKLHCIGRALGLGMAPHELVAIAMASDLCFMVTPAGIGGLPGTAMLFGRLGIPPVAATAMVAADLIFDGTFFAVALPVAWWMGGDSSALLAPSTTQSLAVPGMAAAAVVLGAAAVVAWCLRDRLRAWPMWVRARAFVAGSTARIAAVARADRRLLFGALVAASLQWLARYNILAVVICAVHECLAPSEVFMLQALLNQVAQWTTVPGGVGVTEVGAALILERYMPAVSAGSAVLVWRLVTLHLTVLFGLIAFGWIMRRVPAGTRTHRATDSRDAA